MRFFLVIAFFALIFVLVAAKAGPQHGQHGGAKHDGQQGGPKPVLPLNGTLPALNITSSDNATTTEATTTTEASTTVASGSSTST
ncbi:hypothetical protein KR054_010994 [Drosophila jambulina]|nr:hypothetical protein KR054_010994 [Drosophila jambulina]